MSLSRNQLLGILPRTESVALPALGGTVNVRGLRASEVIDLANKYGTQYGNIPMLIYGVVNDDGTPVYVGDDIPALLQLPFEVVGPLLAAISRLTGAGETVPKDSGANS